MQLTADRRTLDLLITASLIPEPLQQMPRRRTLRLTVDMIKAHLEQLLDDIHREGLPYEVSFAEALGMSEDGGVVKKFTTILIASAIKHRLWKRNGFGLLTSTCDVDDRRLATLGRLYEMIDMRNSRSPEPILFGPLLHPRFFELVMIAMSSSTDEEKIAQLSLILGGLQPDLAIIALVMINPSITNKALVMQLLQCPAGSELEEAKRLIRSFLRAARAFSQDLSPAFRAKISSDPVKVLRDMQGETVTAELILSALRIQDGAMDLVDKFEWLKDKIAHASAVYLRRFLICVTGKQTLSVKDQLIISRSRHPDQFEYRSCFNNLALPHGSLSKQAFYDSLEASLLLEFERY
jgi:hypothetical protein